MKYALILVAFFCSPLLFGQVVPPQDLTLSVAPVVPIDLSLLTETEQENPLETLADTAQVQLRVMFDLAATVNIDLIHFQVGSNGQTNNVLDVELSLNDDLPAEYSRTSDDGFFIYELGNFAYDGGPTITVRTKDVSGNYSAPVTYTEN